MSLPKTVWILTDGHAGNLNPALGLAEALHDHVPLNIVTKTLETKGLGKILPPQILLHSPYVSLFALQGLYRYPFFHPREKLPDIIIGNGRVSVAVCAAMKRYANNTNHLFLAIQLQHPRIGSTWFDLVIPPMHDHMKGVNVLSTLGSLTRMNHVKLDEIRAHPPEILGHLKAPRVVLLVGGRSRSYDFTFPTVDKLCRDVESLTKHLKGSLMITTSRRTEPENIHYLKTRFSNRKDIYLWNGEGENPFMAYLALADIIVVTADSVNMISEGAAAGKPVLIYPLEGGSSKIEDFHHQMIERDLARQFSTTAEIWTPPPFNETKRVSQYIADHFLKHILFS
jgi:uncharacterized protein